MSVPFDKIKQLDKYAKSLGITIYRIDYGFQDNSAERIHGFVGVNKLSDKYYEFLNSMNPYKKCSEKK